VSWTDVSVSVSITALTGVRLDKNRPSEAVRYDLNVRLEEKNRRSGRVVVLFGLSVKTKPNVVKYEVEGTAILTGKDAAIDQILKTDPMNNVPYVFQRVYQHVFTAIYVLASMLDTIYPPCDLLSSSGEGIPIKNFNEPDQTKETLTTATVESQTIKQ
jgi:hypothetical protein